MSGLFPRRAAFKLLLRLLVAGGLLWVVFQKALPEGEAGGWAGLWRAWSPGSHAAHASLGRPSPWLTFGAALVIIGIGFACNALRFRGLLRAAGMPARWAGLLRAYLVASFFNLVLPGAILGDAYRVLDAKALAGRTSNALGLVVLERLLGLSALGSIGLVCVPFLPADLLGERGLGWLPIALSTAFLLSTWVVLQPRTNALLVRACAWLKPLSTSVAESAAAMLVQVGSMWKQPRVLLQTFGLSLVAQGLLVLSLWALGQSLEDTVDWYWYPVIIPFATLMCLVPISIGAAGLREYLYMTLFGMAGMGSASALALSLSIFAASLVWGLVGLFLYCLGSLRQARGIKHD